MKSETHVATFGLAEGTAMVWQPYQAMVLGFAPTIALVKAFAPTTSVASVPLSLAVPAGAIVEEAVFTVKARPPGWTTIGSVAVVREDRADHVVVDFGRMRTVTGVRVSGESTIGVSPWVGTAFGREIRQQDGVTAESFSEVQTERIRLHITDVTVADVEGGEVNLPTAPADLELSVNGTRVWFQAGEAKRGTSGGAVAAAGDHFVTRVDATAQIAAAAATGQAIRVELRAATAGLLALEAKVRLVRVHKVAFPEGPERVLTFSSEGQGTLGLPLPAEASGWTITGVALKVKAKLGPERVSPASGPVLSTAAEVLLDAEHAVAIQVGATQLASFATLTGVRVQLAGEPGGAEVAGALHADLGGSPGAALPGGSLAPLTLTDSEAPTWVTLRTARPVPLPTGVPLWVSLQLSRGRAVLPLAADGDPIARGLPGGSMKPFSRAVPIDPRAKVRVMGEAPENAPIPALALVLGGDIAVAITPTGDGTVATLRPEPPRPAGGLLVDGQLPLGVTAATPGAYRVSEVEVFYQLPGDAA